MNTGPLQRILMVEDDLDIQVVARLSLEAVGNYVVEVCSDGPQALARAAAFAPDLVLLDVMMPEMDGPTVLLHLREIPATSRVPVVFMTAKAQAHEVAAYKAKGAIAVISKPFDPMELPFQLAQVWNDYAASHRPETASVETAAVETAAVEAASPVFALESGAGEAR